MIILKLISDCGLDTIKLSILFIVRELRLSFVWTASNVHKYATVMPQLLKCHISSA